MKHGEVFFLSVPFFGFFPRWENTFPALQAGGIVPFPADAGDRFLVAGRLPIKGSSPDFAVQVVYFFALLKDRLGIVLENYVAFFSMVLWWKSVGRHFTSLSALAISGLWPFSHIWTGFEA